jgi:hypothetical protein
MRNLILLILLLPVCTLSQDREPVRDQVTGIYSDLHYNKEGGDLLGMELVIVPSQSGYTAFVQIAEGGAPYVTTVPFIAKEALVSFTLPQGGPYSGKRFEGKLSESSLAIKSQTGSQATEILKRGPSYWQ